MGNNSSADGLRLPDETSNLRHHKRGLLTTYYEGDNSVGSRFLITLDECETLNGYNSVFGELVDGEAVLSQIEESTHRSGKLQDSITIENSGTL